MVSIRIDFSILIPESFGFATGNITLPHTPNVGECVDILQSISTKTKFDGFTGVLRVEIIRPIEGMMCAMLEDVVLENPDDAEPFALFLESELKLFVDRSPVS